VRGDLVICTGQFILDGDLLFPKVCKKEPMILVGLENWPSMILDQFRLGEANKSKNCEEVSLINGAPIRS
jgi:hypothetical protein